MPHLVGTAPHPASFTALWVVVTGWAMYGLAFGPYKKKPTNKPPTILWLLMGVLVLWALALKK